MTTIDRTPADALPGDRAVEPFKNLEGGAPALLRAALTASLLALLLPVAVAAVPPLWDYPNHLTRYWLLSGGAAVAPMSNWYRVIWDTWTNVAVDAIAMVEARLFGYVAAGQLIVAAAVLLPPLGGALLWRMVHGRMHWWQLSFALLTWGTGVIGGLLNFQIAFGLALVFAAGDLVLANRPVGQALLRV